MTSSRVKPQRVFYFDNNATTRVAPEVVQVMTVFLSNYWGNPSSAYAFGHQITEHLEHARGSVANLINADPREIIFTSCGTESNNSAIHSALRTQADKRHVVTTAVEHSSNLKFCENLTKEGCAATLLPVDSDGALNLRLLEKSIRPDTAIASIMWANNETGVIFPIEEVAAICRREGVLCHTDAVQTPGKLEIDVRKLDVDFLSLSAHKLSGPKGIGALYVRRRVKYQPFVTGGGQEKGRRGGTENVAGIVGFGRAAELALSRLHNSKKVRGLRDRLENGILRLIPGTSRNGAKEPRLANTTNIAFADVEAEGILLLLDKAGICASSGSACTTGSLDPSHVLTAMGCNAARARGSIRFSLGTHNTQTEVDYILKHLPGIIARLRGNSQS